MAALKAVTAAVALVLAMPVGAQVARWRPIVDEASARFDVPADWIERVMAAESAGRTRIGGRPIVSSAGAMGLMQVMPATYADMRGRLGLGADPYDPRDNILAGTLYLRLMYDRFGYPGLFGAYNAGPRRYADHLATGRPLPAETRAYIAATTSRESYAAASRGVAPHSDQTPLRRPTMPGFAPSSLRADAIFFTLRRDAPSDDGPMGSPSDPRRQ